MSAKYGSLTLFMHVLPRDGCFDTAEAYSELDMLVLSLNVQIETLCLYLEGPTYAW